MRSAGNGRRKPNDPSTDVKADTAIDRPDGENTDPLPREKPDPAPATGEPIQQGYVGALRQHKAQSGSSRALTIAELSHPPGYEGSIRAAATFGATKVGDDSKLNSIAVVILSAILSLVTCIIVLALVLVLAGRV